MSDDNLFDVLSSIADKFGWELSKRDPGPIDYVEAFVNGAGGGKPDYCEIDTGWCYTHNAWLDEHKQDRRGADWAPGSELESWAKLAGIIPPDARFGIPNDEDHWA